MCGDLRLWLLFAATNPTYCLSDALHDKLDPVSLVQTKYMKKVNIHQAKTQLSKLVDAASKGESFVIAKAGKPIAKVTALSTPIGSQMQRLGFMEGQISVPDDFDQMGREEIEKIFGGA